MTEKSKPHPVPEERIRQIEERVEAWYDDERNQIPESASQFAIDICVLLTEIGRLKSPPASPVAAEGADSELEAAMESMEAEARKDEQIGYPSDKPSLLLREARAAILDMFSKQKREDKENRLRIGTYVRKLEEELALLKDEELTRNEVELMLAFCHTVKNPDPAVTMLYKKLRRISSPVPPEKK